ncbi:centromere protein Q isoform X2 [Tachysurus fulvidraco]|uniref:centromere protein Q isoform X2 n=1 Tax=Tachysurus fulvidraco TaxID=1234273 RepID=UPI001FEF5163|nr:centromere protein Q isoform X2 [Tachysurus fulvidraco]
MKPARGSSRASTLGPKCAGRRGKNLQQKPVPEIESTQDKTRKKELRKVKSQEKWKPLDPASIRVIDNMLSLSILHVLPMRSKEKEESQKHLNSLKDQFLAKCSQLPVPPQKHGNLMHLSQQFHSENQKIKNGKKKIEALKERSQELVSQLEQLQGKMDCLENECRVMRNNLEEEELKAQTFIQLADQAVLRLPALPRYPEDEPTLQNFQRILRLRVDSGDSRGGLQRSSLEGC